MEHIFPSPKTQNSFDDDSFLYTGQSVARIPKDIKHVIVEDKITSIGEYTFFNCTELVSVEIPNSVTRIENKAFMKCRRLESIKLPPYLTFIGDLAFAGCSNLVKIEIPPIVTSIGKQAFMQCRDLISIRLPSKLKIIEEGTFAVCGNLLHVDIPPSVMHINMAAFMQCTRLCILSIPNPLTAIANNAFYESSTLLCGMAYDDEKFHEHLKSRYANLPLHRVCHKSNPTLEQIEECIRNDYQSARQADYLKLTPLHILAINPTVTQKVMQAVVKAYPKAVSQKSCLGMTPLHFLACNHSAGPDLYLPQIIEATTTSNNSQKFLTSIPDREGRVPTTVAIESRVSLPAQLMFYSRHPIAYELTESRNSSGSDNGKSNMKRSDEEEADHLRCKRIRRLESAYIDQIVHASPPKTHMSSNMANSSSCLSNPLIWSLNLCQGWIKYLSIVSPNQTATEDLVRFLRSPKRCPPSLARHLATVKDSEGRNALDVAAPGVLRKTLMERVLFLGRYDLDSGPPVYRSENCLVRRAMDRRSDLYYRSVFLSIVRASSSIASAVISSGRGEWSKVFMSKSAFIGHLKTRGFSEEQSIEIFSRWSSDREGEISCHEFVSACRDILDGGKRDRVVAIKFGKDRVIFEREKEVRNGNGTGLNSNLVVEITDYYDVEQDEISLMSWFKRYDDDNCRKQLDNPAITLATEEDRLQSYRFALVMPYADRNLDVVISCERLTMRQVRMYAEDIAMAIKHLHDKNIIHGDISLSNLVRSKGKLQAIDLGASVSLRRHSDAIIDRLCSGTLDDFKASIGTSTENVVENRPQGSTFSGQNSLISIDLSKAHNDGSEYDDEDKTEDMGNVRKKKKKKKKKGGKRREKKEETDRTLIDNVVEKPFSDFDVGNSARSIYSDNWDTNAGLYYLGRKFSSSALPPEMIYLCKGHTDVNKFESYFVEQKDIGTIWNKIEPKVCSNGDIYLVKTFLTSYVEKADANEPYTMIEIMKEGFLPYDPILATPAADMWSFGTVLYAMCTGDSLFHTDANGDLSDGNAFAELYHWNDEKKEAKLSKVSCPLARELLGTLLSKDPKHRGDFDSALKSRFFQCLNFGSEDYRMKVAELEKFAALINKPAKSKLLDQNDAKPEGHVGKIMKLEEDNKVNEAVEENDMNNNMANVKCISAFGVKEVNAPSCIVLLPISETNNFDSSIVLDALEKADFPSGVRVKGINCLGAQLLVYVPNGSDNLKDSEAQNV